MSIGSTLGNRNRKQHQTWPEMARVFESVATCLVHSDPCLGGTGSEPYSAREDLPVLSALVDKSCSMLQLSVIKCDQSKTATYYRGVL